VLHSFNPFEGTLLYINMGFNKYFRMELEILYFNIKYEVTRNLHDDELHLALHHVVS